jgi:predicted methyltransferase
VNLIGVSLDADKATTERTVTQRSLFWPQICDGKAENGEIAQLYNVQGSPVLLVIDRAGNIAARLASAAMLDEQLFEVTAADAVSPRIQRDTWQRPIKIADALGLKAGGAVTDVGAGGGYFTFRLAARVGPKGKVFAEDIDEGVLAQIRRQAEEKKLPQIRTIQGSQENPKLLSLSVDAVVVVDAFHEFTHPDAMMAGIAAALKPGGRLGVLDRSARLGMKPAEYMDGHRLPQEMLIDRVTRAGLRLISFDSDFAGTPDGTRYYFAVFEKPRQ